jgi:hypothetical protein
MRMYAAAGDWQIKYYLFNTRKINYHFVERADVVMLENLLAVEISAFFGHRQVDTIKLTSSSRRHQRIRVKISTDEMRINKTIFANYP